MRKFISVAFSISDFLAWLLCFFSLLYALLNPFLLSATEAIFGEQLGLTFKVLLTSFLLLTALTFYGVAKRSIACTILASLFLVVVSYLLNSLQLFMFVIVPIIGILIVPYLFSYLEFRINKV